MNITYPPRKIEIATLSINGKKVEYAIPPTTGDYKECFRDPLPGTRTAQGKEITAYMIACYSHRNEWHDQAKVKFPTKGDILFPYTVTYVPLKREYGDLEGAIILDLEINNGRGVDLVDPRIPNDFVGFTVAEGGIYTQDTRKVIPYSEWNKVRSENQKDRKWDEKNGLLVALNGGVDGLEDLISATENAGLPFSSIWTADPKAMSAPQRGIVYVFSHGTEGNIILNCNTSWKNQKKAVLLWVLDQADERQQARDDNRAEGRAEE